MINIFDLKNKIEGRFWSLLFFLFFKKTSLSNKILRPLRIKGFRNISLGNNVLIQNGSWLEALPLTNLDCNLIVGNNVVIGHFNHIYATNLILIDDDVLIADKVYISDNLHEYENVSIPVMNQNVKQLKPVKIGKGSWIGESVSIIGASIGKNCVIGANSVVTKDIPDYSVAVGAPARIIKKYNIEMHIWQKTNDKGDFI